MANKQLEVLEIETWENPNAKNDGQAFGADCAAKPVSQGIGAISYGFLVLS